MHQLPPDNAVRLRFAGETGCNFSLACPAGSGKTHSLTDRMVSLARSDDAVRVLPRIVVVTYTRKAAEEMQQRARAALVALGLPVAVQQAFNLAFYGTIHSFAVDLLRTHGHFIGVPSVFEVVADTDPLWHRFMQSPELEQVLGQPKFARLIRHIPLRDVFVLARDWDFARPGAEAVGDFPVFDFSSVYQFPLPKRADSAENIRRSKMDFEAFQRVATGQSRDFVPFPRPAKGGKEFLEVSRVVSEGLIAWFADATVELAGAIASAFRAYRVAAGALGYDDQIQFAVELLRNPEAAAAIRSRGYRVMLDEAQDTDPSQFEFLIEAVRPVDAVGHWSCGLNPPAPGRFAMVGDPQQSIYSSRADLATYEQVHKYLTQDGVGEALGFDVTFRCAETIIGVNNRLFPAVLNGVDGQVPYVTLRAKPGAKQGQVVRLPVPAVEDGAEAAVADAEAGFLANWISETGLVGLRARSWGQVAILCPRKRWFPAMRDALLRVGLESQLLSTRFANADSASYAWFTAVAFAVVHAHDGYEIAGVLREAFGVSDSDIAVFTQGKGELLQIETPTTGDGPVESALNRLCCLRAACDPLPLRSQAQLIADLLTPRIAALPLDTKSLIADIDRILLSAADAEADGRSLYEFADALVADWSSIPDEPEDANRVSIITSIKAKGLEWDAVIVPYVYREISTAPVAYPRLIGSRHSAPKVIFNKDEMPGSEAARKSRGDMQELERILYVTCTRARNTLVLVDDACLFGKKGTPEYSAARALRLDTANSAEWAALANVAVPGDNIVPKAICAAPTHASIGLDLDAARTNARNFPRMTRPSQMNHATPVTEEPEMRGPEETNIHSTALDYGVWWHDTMRMIRWGASRTVWQSGFDGRMSTCPDAGRAQREWNLFLDGELALILDDKTNTVLTESPCFIPLDAQAVVDGILDLAIFRKSLDRWLVVDWKTVSHQDTSHYGPQIGTYKAAIQAATRHAADGAIFFTGAGVLAAVDG